VNVPRVILAERYNVSKVRTLQGRFDAHHSISLTKPYPILGFYGVTYSIGFRDDFEVEVQEIIQRICVLEARAGSDDEAGTAQNIAEIRDAARQSTHMCVSVSYCSFHCLFLTLLQRPTLSCC